MLHRLLLAAIVGVSVLAHGQSVSDQSNPHSCPSDTEVIAIPWQGPGENEWERETEVDLEIRLEPTERGKENLIQREIDYEDRESNLPAPTPFPIGTRP